MQNILEHFISVDPILAQALESIGEIPPIVKKGSSSDYFTSLCASIVSQQLSVKVADVIWTRFVHLFSNGTEWNTGSPEPPLSPEELLTIPDQTLRDQGLSWAKIKYVKDLAANVIDKSLVLESLDQLSNEEVVLELTKVKGIGKWTAEMFLMFALARPDVYSLGDLGLKRAIQKLYHLTAEPDDDVLVSITTKWSPYRSYASRILWRTLDNESKTK